MFENYIFIDFDGVILDSEERVLNLKNQNLNISWDEFFDSIDWSILLKESKSINNSVEIIRELESLKRKIAILTKIHTLAEMESKTRELRYNRKINSPILFVPPHIKKSEIFIPRNNEILVDDSIKNINDWNMHGGNGILFDQSDNSKIENKVNNLEFLLRR